MLDAKRIREDVEAVRARLQTRGIRAALDEFVSQDTRRRQLLGEVEQLKHRRNTVSEEVGRRKKQGQDAGELIAEMREVGDRIKRLDDEAAACETAIDAFLLTLPNLPDASVPVGADSSANPEVRRWGEPRRFDFPAKPHW